MRKIFLILAILSLILLPMAAQAGDGCGSKTSTASSSCNAKDASAASSSCSAKGASTASSSCSAKGASAAGSSCGSTSASAASSSCGTKGASAASGCCPSKANTAGAGCTTGTGCVTLTSATCHGDFNLTSYFAMKQAANDCCSTSLRGIATEWHSKLKNQIENVKSADQKAALKDLVGILRGFPYASKSQQRRFERVTAWTAAYCEQFPELAGTAKVVSDPETGNRYVEVAAING